MDDLNKSQKAIESFVEEILSKEEDLIGITEQEKAKKINAFIERLSAIFDNSCDFRPHYFFIYDLVDYKEYFELITPLAYISSIQEFLSKEDFSNQEEYNGLKRYIQDNQLKYKIDMFISAVKYELYLTRNNIEFQDDIKKYKNAPSKCVEDATLEYIKNYTQEFNSTLKEYKMDFEVKSKNFVERSKELEDRSKDFEQKTKDFEAKTKEFEQKTKDFEAKTKEFEQKSKDFEEKSSEFEAKTKEFNKISMSFGRINQRLNAAITDANSLTTNILTILGIFVSIIFIIVGGYFTVSIDNKAFTDITQVNLGRFVLMGQVLFNLIFSFMFMVSRLSSKSIAVDCRGCEKSVCTNNKCSFIMKIWNKYPYVILFNFACLCGYVVFLAWWYLEEFVYKVHSNEWYTFLGNHPLIFTSIIIFMTILSIALPMILFFSYCKKHKSI